MSTGSWSGRKPRTKDKYWEKFNQIFLGDDVMCDILGMENTHFSTRD